MSGCAVRRLIKQRGQIWAVVKQQVISTNIDPDPDPVQLGESEEFFTAKENCIPYIRLKFSILLPSSQ